MAQLYNHLVIYGNSFGQAMIPETLSDPARQIAAERSGLPSSEVRELARLLHWSDALMLRVIDVPPASWTRKKSQDAAINGAPGFAALTLRALLDRAQEVVQATVAPDRVDSVDVGQWLGEWLQTPMPALGGKCPIDLLDVPAGQAVVLRLLGSLDSGAYQ